MMYILTARALSGPDGSGLAIFMETTGASDFIGYIVIGTTVWMWQNIVLWDVGFSLRNEQLRGTLESNWLSPTWRFSYLLGHTGPQIISMLMFIIVTGAGIWTALRRQAERQRMDDPADDAGSDPIHLRIGVCICQSRDHRQGSECIRLPHSRNRDDLLRHHLSGQSFARLDAIHCKMASTNLLDPWNARRSIFERRVDRTRPRSGPTAFVRHLLALSLVISPSYGWNAAPAKPARSDSISYVIARRVETREASRRHSLHRPPVQVCAWHARFAKQIEVSNPIIIGEIASS